MLSKKLRYAALSNMVKTSDIRELSMASIITINVNSSEAETNHRIKIFAETKMSMQPFDAGLALVLNTRLFCCKDEADFP